MVYFIARSEYWVPPSFMKYGHMGTVPEKQRGKTLNAYDFGGRADVSTKFLVHSFVVKPSFHVMLPTGRVSEYIFAYNF